LSWGNSTAGWQFSTGKVLDYYPRDYAFPSIDFSAVKWARYVFPTGILSDRDFVFVEHAGECQRNGRKVGYGVAGSLERPEWGPLHDVVRAEIFMSGYVFRELDPDGDKNLLELTYVPCVVSNFFVWLTHKTRGTQIRYMVQADPKGMIPAWAVNLGAKDQATNVARMRDWLESIVHARARLAAAREWQKQKGCFFLTTRPC
jgi:hypothetical protein